MIILDRLLTGGLRFVFDQIAAAVDQEMDDESLLKEELLTAQMRLELGEIDEEEFAIIEAEILPRLREIENADEDVRRLKQEISAQKGSTYFARMQYGRLVDAALQAHSEKYVAEIFEALRDTAVASRANKPIGDKMIMNAAFLVDREKTKTFDDQISDIAKKYENKLSFLYTGPWPPYNFVNIRLKLERAER